MSDNKFNSILAKNVIAREISKFIKTGELSIGNIEASLCAIEQYIGVGNQPSVNDIIENNKDVNAKFLI